MPDAAHPTAFALVAVTIALVPGPGMLYVLARSLGLGVYAAASGHRTK